MIFHKIIFVGNLPPHILRDSFRDTFPKLCKCVRVNSSLDRDWADARKEAVGALGSIVSHKIIPGDESAIDWRQGIPLKAIDVGLLCETLIIAMEDYTTDQRGDIGSWVRRAAMNTIQKFVFALQNAGEEGGKLLTPSILSAFLALILKQCVEKIDNVRVHAATVFCNIIHADPPFEAIPHLERLIEIFPKESSQTINWRTPAETFPKFLQILPLPEFTHGLLSGLVLGQWISGGGSVALADYLNSFPIEGRKDELERISSVLVTIFKENSKVERVTLPLMLFLTQLFQTGVLTSLVSEEPAQFGVELVHCVKAECLNTKGVEKILGGVELLAELIQGAPSLVKA